MTTYFVSSIIGSNNNAGISSASPLATLQAAEALVKPGDFVEVMNGTYTNGGADVLTITTSGTASAPITFEAAPGATPVIDSSGAWQGIEIDASYITIRGFTVVGDAANITLADALANTGPGNPYYDGNGIAAAHGVPVSHMIIENNTIYNEPGAGIGINNGDYLQILNNNVHDNAHWSAYGASGISIAASWNFDNGPGPHIIIAGNTSVNNAELVPEYRANAITDGEGIILDSNQGYTGGFLVQNNTTHGNSGPGIELFFSDNAVITGNTATGDLTYAPLAGEGEIFINQSNNNTVTNNITNTPPPPPPPGQLVINGDFETHDFGGWTLSGNSGTSQWGPQIFITTNAESGTFAAGLGSLSTDGVLSQDIATVVGQNYTFDFWLANNGGGPNDFTAKVGGVTELSLVNAPAQAYTHYSYDFTATGAVTHLEFDERQDPASWSLDNISVTAIGGPPPPPPNPPLPPTIVSFAPDTAPVGDGHTTATTITLTGTAEANSTVNVYDGTALTGTVQADDLGNWNLLDSGLTVNTHMFTATDTDLNGTSTPSDAFSVTVDPHSPATILGNSRSNTLVGTAGDDIIDGKGGKDSITGGLGADTLTGGSGRDTFVFNASAESTPDSHDTITDFIHGDDKIDFTNIAGINARHGVPTFQGQLTGSGDLTLNAHSVAYIELVTGNTVVLVNTTNSAETVTSTDFGAANMEIDLVGTDLHLASTDFHHF